MTDFKYELELIGIVKEQSKIDDSLYHEIQLKDSFIYSILNDELFKKQKKLSKVLANKVPINISSIAYKRNLSYYDFLLPHKDNYDFIRLDIKTFFHSLKEKYIRKSLENYFKNTDNTELLEFDDGTVILDSFINLTMINLPNKSNNKKYMGNRILPIGFPASPIISNIVFRSLDIQIQRFCLENNIVYTRYADDLLFSYVKTKSKDVLPEKLIEKIQKILSQLDLRLNKKKTLIKKHTLSLNGFVISKGEIRLSNKKTKIISKIIHLHRKETSYQEILHKLFKYKLPVKCNSMPDSKQNKFYEEQFLNKLTGYRSFLISILKYNTKYTLFSEKTYIKYSELILELEEIIDELLE